MDLVELRAGLAGVDRQHRRPFESAVAAVLRPRRRGLAFPVRLNRTHHHALQHRSPDHLPLRQRRAAFASPAAPDDRVRRDGRNAWNPRSDIEPGQHRRVDQFDAFGNPVTRIELAQPHRELTVHSRMLIDVYPRAMVPMDGTLAVGTGAQCLHLQRHRAGPRCARCLPVPPRVAARAPQTPVQRVWRRVLYRRQANTGLRQRAMRPAVCGPDLCTWRDHHQHLGHRSAGTQAWRVPGLRPPDDRLPALTRTARALCQWLPAHHHARRCA